MKPNRKNMLAALVRESRIAKGFTQKDLSELTNISTRSIQRIESGELTPRLYTIKTLASVLDFSLEEIEREVQGQDSSITIVQKRILSVSSILIILYLAWAFVAQSSRFPETHFETFLFLAVITLSITTILFFIWKRRA